MSAKPYPAYKNSEVSLLADIPEHWGVTRLRSALDIKKTLVGERSGEHLLLSLTIRGVIPRDMENRIGKLPADFTTYQAVNRGDLVFCLFDVEETPRTVGWVPEPGMVTGAYTSARVRTIFEPKYVAYHYLSFDQYKSLRGYYAGLRNTIRTKDFFDIPLAYPPLLEQRAIVRYLDRETAEIDAFIADQEDLIRLLNERRVALLLDETLGGTGFKSSRPLGRVLTKLNREPLPNSEIVTAYRDGMVTTRASRREEGYTLSDLEQGYQGVEPGDLVFHGLDGFAGAVGLSDSAGRCSPVYHVCKVSKTVDASYVALHLRALGISGFLAAHAWSVRQRAVDYRNWKTFSKLPMNFPSLEAQQRAVSRIHRETSELDGAIEDAKASIELSKERRAALISAVVTGKIDIRNHRLAEGAA